MVASHIKPWSKANDYEKQDENNGLLLCVNHDALFDKGYITFDENNKLCISDNINKFNYDKLNIDTNTTINLNKNQIKYMKYHREKIFK